MPLDELWQDYRTHGYARLRAAVPSQALDWFYLALVASGEGDIPRAAHCAQEAARLQPASRVYAQGAAYLARVWDAGKTGVYVDGTAFAAFIRGGGNIGLYAAVSAALRAVYAGYASFRLLDVGVGDGLALLPALVPQLTGLTLVEPSEAMLGKTLEALKEQDVACQSANMTLQAFMDTPQGQRDQWDIIQATWSLQSIPPDERPEVFAWLRAHGRRVLVAEFDVPDFPAMFAPERVRYIIARYERGLAEYDGDGGLVAQGFLMPVMFGYFDRSTARTNWEGPLQGWIAALQAAGFERVTARKLFDYFWADAYLVDAR